jgi:Fur family transcriptional regulator, ferric uptake regulator
LPSWYSGSNSVWRFELPSMKSADHDRHLHFVCNECGEVACLPESAVALRDEAVRHRVVEVQLRGGCVDCARSR